MCCRYVIWLDGSLRVLKDQAEQSALAEPIQKHLQRPLKTEGEIRPGDLSVVIARSRKGELTSFPMVWGFQTKQGNALIINARSETAMEKQMFAESWKSHRCIIPSSCYFEWLHQAGASKRTSGTKYAVKTKQGEITWLCGLYRMEENIPHYVILTREPSEDVRFLHDRMPMILPQEKIREWLDPSADADALSEYAVKELQAEPADHQ